MSPTTFTEGTAGSLAPWADPAGDWVAYNAALSSMFEQVYGLVADQGSPDEPASYTAGWSTLLDPTACPEAFLPFCGMFCGVVVPPGTDEVTARALIIAEQNFQRGTGFSGSYSTSTIPAGGAIVGAAQRFLSGTQSVTLIERVAADSTTLDPYHFVIMVLAQEAQPTNLVPNPSFEYDTVGSAPVAWSTTVPSAYVTAGATVTAQSSYGAESGSNAMRVVTTATTHEGAAISLGVLPAGTYSFAAYIKGNAGGESLAIFYYASSGANSANFVTATTSYARYSSNSFTADGTSTYYVGVRSNAAAVYTFLVDAVMVASGPTLLPYVDGDTVGWTGTPGDSVSQTPIWPLIAAVNAVKPGGVQWTLIQTATWTIAELEASAYTPISTTESTFATISNLETDVI